MVKEILFKWFGIDKEPCASCETLRSQLEATVTDDSCLAITNVGEQSPAFDHDIWLTIWRISINPGCPTGDYAVTFKALERGSLRGQTQIVVKITP